MSLVEQPASPSVRTVPIGVLSGHYGAGKTLLLAQLLGVHRGGPLAMVLFHRTGISPDANAIRGASRAAGRTRDQVWTVPVASETSASRDAFIAALREAAQARRFERIWVEIDPALDPAHLAAWIAAAALEDAAFRLVSWWHITESVQFWHEQVRVAPERLRPPERFACEQQLLHLRAASAVFLREETEMGPEVLARCHEFVQIAAPDAELLTTVTGEWERQQVINALSAFVPAHVTEATAGAIEGEPAPIESFSFTAHRPLHPGRFWDFLGQDRREIWRMKGYFWLASRPELVGGLSHSGPHYSCGLAGSWWVNIPREQWPTDPAERARIDAAWQEPFGDRRQELVITGTPGCEQLIRAGLEACLLTLAEMKAGPEEWALWLDPFPGWEMGEEERTVATPLNGG